VVFTALYLLASVCGAILTGNREFVFYLVVMLLLILGMVVVHRRVGFSRGVLWALSVWGLAHMAGGLVPVPASWAIDGGQFVLYSVWIIPERLKYDQLVHAYGFGTTTVVCWQGLQFIVRPQSAGHRVQPTLGMLTLCAAASVGFGACNEVVEFVAKLTIPNTNVGGYENTGWDLVANLVGAVAASAIIWFRHKVIDPA
jgi:hypothetical protein